VPEQQTMEQPEDPHGDTPNNDPTASDKANAPSACPQHHPTKQ